MCFEKKKKKEAFYFVKFSSYTEALFLEKKETMKQTNVCWIEMLVILKVEITSNDDLVRFCFENFMNCLLPELNLQFLRSVW